VFVFTTLISCIFTCIRRRCCRRKKKDEDGAEDGVVVHLQVPMEMPGNPHPLNQPHEMASYHLPTSPMASSAINNQGYQTKLGKTGRANR
jgi:hypothetical protein